MSPVTSWYRMTAAEYRSARPSSGSARACSGDMYSGVPHTRPCTVSIAERSSSPSLSVALAMPKSHTLTKSCSPRRSISMMLLGLRSRWITPCACASSSAFSTCVMIAADAQQRQREVVADHLRQIAPGQQLHRDVERAVVVFARVDDLDRIRVVEQRRALRLALEAGDQPVRPCAGGGAGPSPPPACSATAAAPCRRCPSPRRRSACRCENFRR